jgi:hypothetical protein
MTGIPMRHPRLQGWTSCGANSGHGPIATQDEFVIESQYQEDRGKSNDR